MDIFPAYQLELFILANKANMRNLLLPYMKLEELVDRSGEMMEYARHYPLLTNLFFQAKERSLENALENTKIVFQLRTIRPKFWKFGEENRI